MNIIPDIKTPIFKICEDMDSRLAVTALALDAILVTADSDFQRVDYVWRIGQGKGLKSEGMRNEMEA